MRNGVMFELVFNLQKKKKKKNIEWMMELKFFLSPQKNPPQEKPKWNIECELSPCAEQMLVNRSCLPWQQKYARAIL